jgi:uncharacterized peroxidase-related enzyme
VTLDEDFANALRRDWRTASLSEPDRMMLGYVEKVTKAPVSISQEDIAALRSVGFDDTGILQINLIASWFNYINRVADGLGVGRT